ncbi:hypothetical protein I6F33_09070 [Bradyrhizobium sp. BRP20]|uniref:hypothetical protein n=1 Tax=Bradyrhizobium sp. BRP20 TaxID=2793822 RepID=UPI001CD4048C|nr:hypothetical protein [Bradyrhizobium sp. BRP20]MCA1433123.1 hypothetical protein [Bradyrhizobium sp. BRP20]
MTLLALRDSSPQAVLQLLDELEKIDDPFSSEFEQLDLGDWPQVHVYIPHPEVSSSITPPFMEAFLELQKQIYRLAAQASAGLADAGQLSEATKADLQISVLVTDGSSNLTAKLERILPGLLKQMIGKLNGKQAAIVLVSVAALVGGNWAFTAWLEEQKAIKIEELKSKDHIEALKALSLGSSGQLEALKKITSVLEKQGEIGSRALEAIAATNDALLKAASKTSESSINDTHLTRQEAELLRTTPRKKPELRIAKQRMRVLDINTSDPHELSVLISSPDKKQQYRIKFGDTLFSDPSRKAIFEALDSRDSIWMELAFREIDGEVKSVQLLQTTKPPALADTTDRSDEQ